MPLPRRRNYNQRLNGLNPLAYLGDNSYQPPEFIMDNRPPTSSDSKNFEIGAIWLNMEDYPDSPTSSDVYMLVSLAGNVATWINFAGGAGNLETLTGNSGGAVSPTAGNIDVLGDTTTINVVGNPAAHKLTISTSGTGVVSTLTGDTGGPISPVSGNINVLGTSGRVTTAGAGNTITWDVGSMIADTYTTDSGDAEPLLNVLNVLGSGVISTSGAGNTVTIIPSGDIASSFITNPATGTATPSSGVLTFAGAGATTVSAAGSTITITSTDSDSGGLGLVESGNVSTNNGTYRNLGMSIDTVGFTVTIHGADGNALSASNPAFVAFSSGLVPGTMVSFRLESNFQIAWGDMTGALFGTVAGVGWGNTGAFLNQDDMPLYLYAIMGYDETEMTFGFGRYPHETVLGSAAGNGWPTNAAGAAGFTSMFQFDNINNAGLDRPPLMCVGSVRAYKTAGDAWVFRALQYGYSGIGHYQENQRWIMPPNVNNNSNRYFYTTGGSTLPTFTTSSLIYWIKKDGTAECVLETENLSVIGVGATPLYVVMPFWGQTGVVPLTLPHSYMGTASVGASVAAANQGLWQPQGVFQIIGGQVFNIVQFVKIIPTALTCAAFTTTGQAGIWTTWQTQIPTGRST